MIVVSAGVHLIIIVHNLNIRTMALSPRTHALIHLSTHSPVYLHPQTTLPCPRTSHMPISASTHSTYPSTCSTCRHTCISPSRHYQVPGVVGCVELDWWSSAECSTASVTCTPAQHFSGRTLWDRDATLWARCIRSSLWLCVAVRYLAYLKFALRCLTVLCFAFLSTHPQCISASYHARGVNTSSHPMLGRT